VIRNALFKTAIFASFVNRITITILALTDNLFRCRELSENLFRRTKTEIGNSNRVSGKSLCIKYKQTLCFSVSFQSLLKF
jgi:hypothetical protein